MMVTASEICLTTSSEMFNSAMWLASAGRDILQETGVARSQGAAVRHGFLPETEPPLERQSRSASVMVSKLGAAYRRLLGATAAPPIPLVDKKAEVRRRVLANEFHIAGAVQTAAVAIPEVPAERLQRSPPPGQSVVTARKAVAILETCCSRMPAGHGIFASRGA